MINRNSVAALAAMTSLAVAAPISSNLLFGSSFGIPGQDYTFDYIVVGGGNAGLTVAARLAENPSLTVGVIEAGTFYEETNGNNSQIPAYDNWFTGKAVDDWQPGIDWGFATTPQSALLNASVHYARGKCFGGSSARNYMNYHVGTTSSYQMWADYVGDDSYTYDNFYPYFKKSQNFTPPDMSHRMANATPEYDDSLLGTSGPLSVLFPPYAGAFGTWVMKGLAAVGMKPINGFEGGKLLGSGWALSTIDHDTNVRESSEVAFLQPALQNPNPNLILFPSTMGRKIIFDSSNTATGVQVSTDGLDYTINAAKEVIISAGAFQSPQLLMVSGVGPAATLQQHGISVIADRPGVGQNLTDHVYFGQTYRVNVVTGSNLAYDNNTAIAEEQFHEGYGPLTNPGVDVIGWERLTQNTTSSSDPLAPLNTFPDDWPHIEILSPGGYFGLSENYQEHSPNDGYQYATLVSALVAPLSRGTISISSASTLDAPLIDPNWMSDPTDKAAAIAGFKRTRDIWATDAMQPILIGDEYYPGKSVSTDDEIWEFIQKSFAMVYHASVSCRMGRTDDPNAVVDSHARVIGVKNLRVVDTSSFALLPPGHPMATLYALAEKISDDILNGN